MKKIQRKNNEENIQFEKISNREYKNYKIIQNFIFMYKILKPI